MKVLLVVCAFLGFLQSSLAATFTGYIIDNFCWNRPNHVAIDGAHLETRPQDHYLHCLLLRICKPDGYALLEEYDDNGVTKYRIKYQLDAAGNAMAIQFFQDQINIRDRKFNDQVTITGELGGDGLTIMTAAVELFMEGGTMAPTPLPTTMAPTPPTVSPTAAPTLTNPTLFPTASPAMPTPMPTLSPMIPMSGAGTMSGLIGSSGVLREGFWVIIAFLIVIYLVAMFKIFKPARK